MLDSINEGLENVYYEKWNYPVDPTVTGTIEAPARKAMHRIIPYGYMPIVMLILLVNFTSDTIRCL